MDDIISGQNNLRHALTSCDSPVKAIEAFQFINGIAFQSIRPLLPLLDLHMIPRLDVHTSILEELRDKLIQQINDLNTKLDAKERDKKLTELLNKSYRLIRFKQLQPVVMTILKNMQQMDN